MIPCRCCDRPTNQEHARKEKRGWRHLCGLCWRYAREYALGDPAFVTMFPCTVTIIGEEFPVGTFEARWRPPTSETGSTSRGTSSDE